MPPNREVLPCVLCDANTQSAPAIGTAEFSCCADDRLLIRNFCQNNEACTEEIPATREAAPEITTGAGVAKK
jgi:hypothetical protein